MIDAGKMRHRITFEAFNETVGTGGDIRDDLDANWTAFWACWAAIDPVSGREFYAAEQSQSEVTHKIRCRYHPGIQAAMRIRYGSRIFEIRSLIDWEERHESFLIMARELIA